MPNTLMTPKEVGEHFMISARKQIAEMDIATVQKFAAMDTFQPGITGGIAAFLAVAAKERLSTHKQ